MNIVEELIGSIGIMPKTIMLREADTFLSSINITQHRDSIYSRVMENEDMVSDDFIATMDHAMRVHLVEALKEYGIVTTPDAPLNILQMLCEAIYAMDTWDDHETLAQLADGDALPDDAFFDLVAEVTCTPQELYMEHIVDVREVFTSMIRRRMESLADLSVMPTIATYDRKWLRSLFATNLPRYMIDAFENGVMMGQQHQHYIDFIIHAHDNNIFEHSVETVTAEYIAAYLASGEHPDTAHKVVPDLLIELYESQGMPDKGVSAVGVFKTLISDIVNKCRGVEDETPQMV